MISDIEDYFAKGCGRCARFDTPDCSARLRADGLGRLRGICVGAGLGETVKWGHPCYVHAGRNVALIGAVREDFRLTFMEAGLMTDPEGVLERAGPNTRHAGMLRFSDAGDVARLEPVLRAYLAEAMGYAEAGLKAPREAREIELPEDFVTALDADPDLAQAFHALTPGRQRSYVINLDGAKRPETRMARIAGFRARILAGKGANER